MGGSGGGFFSKSDNPVELAKKTRESEKSAQDIGFETEINGYLSSELAGFNDRDSETINTILDDISKDLDGQVEGTLDLLFGGSVSKHTYVDGLSDIDALIFFDRTDLSDTPPSQLLRLLSQTLKERYGEDNVRQGEMAVTLNRHGCEIQLLPALRSGDAFKVSRFGSDNWSLIRPKKFADALTKVNKELSGKVVPTIKLVKNITSNLPEKQQLSGYHVESLAIKIFRQYDGPMTPKAMLSHFFSHASQEVKSAIKDSTGQSIHVDEYLGANNSTQRRVVSMALDRISRKIQNANAMKSQSQWRKIMGE